MSKLIIPNRPPKLWCDEETPGIQPGDYYCDIMGTWKVDPDGSWRPYHLLTSEELAESNKLAVEGAKRDREKAAKKVK